MRNSWSGYCGRQAGTLVRHGNDALETVRKKIRKDLNTRQRLKLKDDAFYSLLEREEGLATDSMTRCLEWFDLHPELRAGPYRMKESFH